VQRIVVVDDELLIRKGITSLFDKEDTQFQVVGEFADGTKALEHLGKLHPQIVLTDVKMPVMSGIELTAEIKKSYPQVKVLLLSGYNEFDLVRKGFLAGADDYLLKSELSKELLLERLQNIAKENENSETPLPIDYSVGSLSYDKLSVFSEEELHLLLNDGKGKGQDQGQNQGIYFGCIALWPFMVKEHMWQPEKSFDEVAVSLSKEILSESFYCCVVKKEMNVYAVFASPKPHIQADEMLCGRFSKRVEKLLEQLTSYCCMFRMKKFDFSENADSGVMTVIRLMFLKILGTDAADKQCNDAADFEVLFTKLRNEMKTYSLSAAERILNRIDIKFLEHCNCFRKLSYYTISLLLLLNEFLENHKQIQDNTAYSPDIVASLQNSFEMIGLYISIKNDILHILAQGINNKKNPGIIAAERYIHENYSTDLSLPEIAEYAHLSPFYLSNLFSKANGSTITDYINFIRLQKACELLTTTNMMIYEIAAAVGYENVTYFSKIFKKTYDITPLEYKIDKK
jgi:two-component system, response regulator YesN